MIFKRLAKVERQMSEEEEAETRLGVCVGSISRQGSECSSVSYDDDFERPELSRAGKSFKAPRDSTLQVEAAHPSSPRRQVGSTLRSKSAILPDRKFEAPTLPHSKSLRNLADPPGMVDPPGNVGAPIRAEVMPICEPDQAPRVPPRPPQISLTQPSRAEHHTVEERTDDPAVRKTELSGRTQTISRDRRRIAELEQEKCEQAAPAVVSAHIDHETTQNQEVTPRAVEVPHTREDLTESEEEDELSENISMPGAVAVGGTSDSRESRELATVVDIGTIVEHRGVATSNQVEFADGSNGRMPSLVAATIAAETCQRLNDLEDIIIETIRRNTVPAVAVTKERSKSWHIKRLFKRKKRQKSAPADDGQRINLNGTVDAQDQSRDDPVLPSIPLEVAVNNDAGTVASGLTMDLRLIHPEPPQDTPPDVTSNAADRASSCGTSSCTPDSSARRRSFLRRRRARHSPAAAPWTTDVYQPPRGG